MMAIPQTCEGLVRDYAAEPGRQVPQHPLLVAMVQAGRILKPPSRHSQAPMHHGGCRCHAPAVPLGRQGNIAGLKRHDRPGVPAEGSRRVTAPSPARAFAVSREPMGTLGIRLLLDSPDDFLGVGLPWHGQDSPCLVLEPRIAIRGVHQGRPVAPGKQRRLLCDNNQRHGNATLWQGVLRDRRPLPDRRPHNSQCPRDMNQGDAHATAALRVGPDLQLHEENVTWQCTHCTPPATQRLTPWPQLTDATGPCLGVARCTEMKRVSARPVPGVATLAAIR